MNAPIRRSFNSNGVQTVWDSTSLKRADTCPRKYQYEMIEGWTSPYHSVHLWFGSIYASSLELFHKLCAAGEERELAIREVIRHALVESWNHDRDSEGNRIPGTGSPARFDHATKNRETLIRTIVWYFDHFAEDHYSTYLTHEGKAAVEFSFQLPVDNNLTLSGHIDRLCVDSESNLFVHDQKTTGTTIGPHYFKSFKPDIQFSLYTLAAKIIYNAPVKGVIIDAAQIAVGFSRFGRSPMLHTDDELNEFYDETMALIEQTQAYTRENYFPRRTTSCGNYGGCVFREVCSRPPQVRENFLKADFVKGKLWDPMEAR